jgi:tetratricopeptide (TPR) repeat protein
MEAHLASVSNLLRRCTVRVGTMESGGTGFFVAPGKILTCSHVVEAERSKGRSVEIWWEERPWIADIQAFLPNPYPDLALLGIELTEHPCVFLENVDIDPGEKLYAYGYPDDYREGDSALFEYEGPAYLADGLLKLKGAQARPGLSGAPLLSLRGGSVCGIVKRSRDRYTALGARAVPTLTILASLPELVALQEAFHARDQSWAASVSRDGTTTRVAELPTEPIRESARPATQVPFTFNVPHIRNPHFTGRTKLLEHILNRRKYPSTQIQAIQGSGGVGKTQLAVEYAYSHGRDYTGVWWVRAENPALLASDYDALAYEVEIVEADQDDHKIVQRAVRRFLETPRREDERWLLIFDNARDPHELRDYIPRKGNCDVLITSRRRDWSAIADTIDVGVLTPDEARDFLVKRTGETDTDAAARLAEELGWLPLALEQAGAFVAALPKFRTLAGYLELYRQRPAVARFRHAPETGDYGTTVETTWDISFNEVKAVLPAAANLLNFCAFLAPDALPLDLFLANASRLPDQFTTAVFDPELRAVEVARRYSLLEVGPGQTLTMHRLVQSVARDRLTDEERRKWASTAVHVLDAIYPTNEEETLLEPGPAALVPHALAAASHAAEISVEPITAASLFGLVGRHLLHRGQLTEARPVLERSLTILEETLGPEHLDVAASANNLAVVVRELGDLDSARNLIERAVAIEVKAFGPDSPEIVPGLVNLAATIRDQGDLPEARRLLERALKIQETFLSLTDPALTKTLSYLGNVLHAQGNLPAAQRVHQRSLDIAKTAPGIHQRELASSANNLASVLIARGELEQAKPMLEDALIVLTEELGPDHLRLVPIMSNLGSVLQMQGTLDGALAQYEQALAIEKRALGPLHLDVAETLGNIGSLVHAKGVLDEAQAILEEALAIASEAVGPDHPSVASINMLLGHVLQDRGNLREARLRYQNALPVLRKSDNAPAVTSVLHLIRQIDEQMKRGGRR